MARSPAGWRRWQSDRCRCKMMTIRRAGGTDMGATAILSAFASRIRIRDISTAAIAATKRHILDCVGVALAAAVEPAGRIILDITQEQGGVAQARIFGSSLRTGAVAAAWANGALAHLLDFDDTR